MTHGFIPVGTIVKCHGLHGELVVNTDIENSEVLLEKTLFFIQNIRTDFEPYRVNQSRLVNKNNRYSFFVKFDRINSREDASELKNRELFLTDHESKNLIFPETGITDYIGYHIIYDDKEIGILTDVITTAAHDILHISMDKEEILVPAVDEYIKEVNNNSRQIFLINIDRFTDVP